jgi:hypothetical protein
VIRLEGEVPRRPALLEFADTDEACILARGRIGCPVASSGVGRVVGVESLRICCALERQHCSVGVAA